MRQPLLLVSLEESVATPLEAVPVVPVINLSGPLTMYGSSISSETVAEAAAYSLRHHWDMDALGRWANDVIRAWSGAEAGMLTSSSASGITLTVAACMTGCDPGRVWQLPDTTGMKREVVLQAGHAVNFGAPIEQMIRLAGATPRIVGTINRTQPAAIRHVLGPDTAAAMFVISHHTVQYGCVPLEAFVALCHAEGVPVIVDAAAQDQQIERIVASGADLIVLSGQKYLSGPTAGVVCGGEELVRAVELQSIGIGRTMKIGKEGVFGTIVALQERMALDLSDWAIRQHEQAAYLADRLQDLPGVRVSLEKDSVGQPVTRVKLVVDPDAAGTTAEALCQALIACNPSIKPRAHHTDEGWFLLEPVHITRDEMDIVIEALHRILAA